MTMNGANHMITYIGWGNIPEGLSTKTRLKDDYGLKPGKDCPPVAKVRANTPMGWKNFDLYRLADCIEIKKRKIDISGLEMDNKTLSEALNIINKSAKKSRDTKTENYYRGRHGTVSAAKTRQIKLYKLKDKVISKLKLQGRLKPIGYHMQLNQTLLLYEFGNHTFHVKGYRTDELPYLGDLPEKISAEKAKKTTLNYFQAVKLLKAFMGEV